MNHYLNVCCCLTGYLGSWLPLRRCCVLWQKELDASMLCMCSHAASLCVSTRLEMNFSPSSPFHLVPPTCITIGSQPLTLVLLLFDSLLHISSSSHCENEQSSRSNCHSHKCTLSLWQWSCLLSPLSRFSLTTSSHTRHIFQLLYPVSVHSACCQLWIQILICFIFPQMWRQRSWGSDMFQR